MPTQWSTFPVKFQGGLVTNKGRLEQGLQALGSATLLRNFESSIQGGYSKILGYSKFTPDPVPSSGQIVGVVVLSEGSVLVSRGGNYYLSTGSSWAYKISAINTGFTEVRHAFFNFNGNNKVIIVDGLNSPLIYDITADSAAYDMAAPADVVGASIVVKFKNHIFFAKDNLLTFTVPYEETNYEPGDGAGVINIGNTITGLVVFREELIVFAVDSIYRISGNTEADFQLNPIADRTGCLSHDTIREIGGDIIYLGPDGIRYLSATVKNNDFGLERASGNIQNEITNLISVTNKYSSTVLRAKSQYRIFTYEGSVPASNTEAYSATMFSDQNVSKVEWSQLRGFKVYAIDSKQFNDKEIILFSSDQDYIYRMESGNSFDSQPIECVFETPFMPLTDPRIRKTLYKHSLYSTTSGVFNLTCGIKIDYRQPKIIQPSIFTVGSTSLGGAVYGDSGSLYGVVVYSAPAQDLFVNTVVGSGLTFALRYFENSTNPSFNLDYAVLEYRTNERR